MKKKMTVKFFFKLGGLLLVCGALLVGVGFGLGGTLHLKQERLGGISYLSWASEEEASQEFIWTNSNKEAIKQVTLELSLGNVDVVKGDAFSIRGRGVSDQDVKVTFEQGNLQMVYGSNESSTILLESKQWVITVPSTLESINLSSDVGNIVMSDIEVQSLHVDASLGNVSIINANSDDISVKSSCGNVQLLNSEFQSVDILNELGNVEVKLPHMEDDYSYKLNSDVGNKNINNQKVDHSYVMSTKYKYQVAIETNVGNITITTQK